MTSTRPRLEWTLVGSRLALGLAVLSTVAVFATAWAYFFVAQPMSDDFSAVERGLRELNAFNFAYTHYFNWSGRWASHLVVQWVFNHVDALRQCWTMLVPLGLVELFALHAGCRALLGDQVPRKTIALLAVAVNALLWAGRPWPGQTVYWFSAGVPYYLGPSLTILLVAWLSRCGRPGTGRMQRAVQVAALSLLAVFICGLHEMTAAVSCVLLTFGAGAALRVRSRNRPAWSVVWAFAIAGFLFSFLAPGNAARGAEMAHGGDLARTIGVMSQEIPILARWWLLDPKLLTATALVALHPRVASLRPAWLTLPGIPWKLVVPAVSCVLVLGCLAAPPWATGYRAAGRTLDLAYAVFLITWLTSVFVVTRGWTFPARHRPRFELLGSAALLAYAVALVSAGNARTAIPDLASGRAHAWKSAVLERFETMREEGLGHGVRAGDLHRDGKDLVIASLPDCPRVLWAFPDEPGHLFSDPAHWSNIALAEIFGFFSVRLAGPPSAISAVPLTLEVTARAGDLVEVRLTGPPRRSYALDVRELVRDDAGGGVAPRPLAEPIEAIVGRLDRSGGIYRRIGLPHAADTSVVGWRILGRLTRGVARTVPPSFVDVPLDPDR